MKTTKESLEDAFFQCAKEAGYSGISIVEMWHDTLEDINRMYPGKHTIYIGDYHSITFIKPKPKED